VSTGGTTSTAGSTGTGGGTAAGCLADWMSSTDCASKCTGATQGDQLKCVEVLDCYEKNSCGPSTWSSNDQTSGSNKRGFGAAPYPLAKAVYDCLCTN
jgi:hypothetical protein